MKKRMLVCGLAAMTQSQVARAEPKKNLEVGPIAWLDARPNVGLSLAPGPRTTLRLAVGTYEPLFDRKMRRRALEFSASTPLYLAKAYKGPFIEPGTFFRVLDRQSAPGSRRLQAGPSFHLGWHWRRPSGINLAVALGTGYNLVRDQVARSRTVSLGYMKIGYAF